MFNWKKNNFFEDSNQTEVQRRPKHLRNLHNARETVSVATVLTVVVSKEVDLDRSNLIQSRRTRYKKRVRALFTQNDLLPLLVADFEDLEQRDPSQRQHQHRRTVVQLHHLMDPQEYRDRLSINWISTDDVEGRPPPLRTVARRAKSSFVQRRLRKLVRNPVQRHQNRLFVRDFRQQGQDRLLNLGLE